MTEAQHCNPEYSLHLVSGQLGQSLLAHYLPADLPEGWPLHQGLNIVPARDLQDLPWITEDGNSGLNQVDPSYGLAQQLTSVYWGDIENYVQPHEKTWYFSDPNHWTYYFGGTDEENSAAWAEIYLEQQRMVIRMHWNPDVEPYDPSWSQDIGFFLHRFNFEGDFLPPPGVLFNLENVRVDFFYGFYPDHYRPSDVIEMYIPFYSTRPEGAESGDTLRWSMVGYDNISRADAPRDSYQVYDIVGETQSIALTTHLIPNFWKALEEPEVYITDREYPGYCIVLPFVWSVATQLHPEHLLFEDALQTVPLYPTLPRGFNALDLSLESNLQIYNSITLQHIHLVNGINWVPDWDHSLVEHIYCIETPEYLGRWLCFLPPDGPTKFWLDPSLEYLNDSGLTMIALDALRGYQTYEMLACTDWTKRPSGLLLSHAQLDPDDKKLPVELMLRPADSQVELQFTEGSRIEGTDFYAVPKDLALIGSDLEDLVEPKPDYRMGWNWLPSTMGISAEQLRRYRGLIGDGDPPYYFSNAELMRFYALEQRDMEQAAAMALETWAGRVAYGEGAFQAGGVSVNGPAMAAELRQRAAELRIRLLRPGYVLR